MTPQAPLDVTIITGMSGAGRSEAAHVLEDLGFFVIDNLPPSLITKVAELARDRERPVRYGLVVDVRSGDFLADLRVAREELNAMGARVRILFLDASDEALVRRYEASRRRHPLSASDRVIEGITRERELLQELRGESDIVLDTSNVNVHELRERLRPSFGDDPSATRLQPSIVSFGYKHGLPLDVDLVFDCRFLPNPHWIESLRPLSGLDQPVRDYVLSQPETDQFLRELDSMFGLLLPAFERERKSYLTIGVGCTGGQHRSVVLAEELARLFSARGYRARVHHRDVDRDATRG